MYPEKNILRARLRFHQVRLVTFSCLPLLLAACGTVTPVSLTQDEIKDRVTADSKAIYADQEPVTAPITSVPGRTGYLRGQLMRDQDTGEYLVQALGGAPGSSSHLLATLAEANCLVIVPTEAEQIRTGESVDVAFLAQRG